MSQVLCCAVLRCDVMCCVAVLCCLSGMALHGIAWELNNRSMFVSCATVCQYHQSAWCQSFAPDSHNQKWSHRKLTICCVVLLRPHRTWDSFKLSIGEYRLPFLLRSPPCHLHASSCRLHSCCVLSVIAIRLFGRRRGCNFLYCPFLLQGCAHCCRKITHGVVRCFLSCCSAGTQVCLSSGCVCFFRNRGAGCLQIDFSAFVCACVCEYACMCVCLCVCGDQHADRNSRRVESKCTEYVCHPNNTNNKEHTAATQQATRGQILQHHNAQTTQATLQRTFHSFVVGGGHRPALIWLAWPWTAGAGSERRHLVCYVEEYVHVCARGSIFVTFFICRLGHHQHDGGSAGDVHRKVL